jgi:hypothetical protein
MPPNDLAQMLGLICCYCVDIEARGFVFMDLSSDVSNQISKVFRALVRNEYPIIPTNSNLFFSKPGYIL